MPWTNKDEWQPRTTVGHYKRKGRIQLGVSGNHVDPNPYDALFSRVSLGEVLSPNGVPLPQWAMGPTANCVSWFWNSSVPAPVARNAAWASLVGKTRIQPAQLGVALAEIGESAGMIAARASQCYNAYRHLRRGDFRPFLRELGIGAKRKHRNLIRNSVSQASSLWLEYSFGWSPLFHDMWTGADAIGQPLPGGHVVGRGSESIGQKIPSDGTLSEEWFGTCFCSQKADIFVSNPNLYLLQQLGVANPISIAWELVPFSFVADWVFDIGSCLNGFTDLLGCEIRRPTCTYTFKGSVTVRGYWDNVPYPGAECGGSYTMMKRRTSLSHPMPNLNFKSNIGGSLKRAANAVSLLGQILTK